MNRLKRWRELNQVLNRNKKAKPDDDSAAYSYEPWNEVEKIFKVTPYNHEQTEIDR